MSLHFPMSASAPAAAARGARRPKPVVVHTTGDLGLPGADVRVYRNVFSPSEKDEIRRLIQQLPWRQQQVKVYGRTHDMPRLTCQLSSPGGLNFHYSQVDHVADEMPPALRALADQLSQRVGGGGHRANFVLGNCYRNGHDNIGWHADDESQHAPGAPIISVSFGATRTFALRAKNGSGPVIKVPMTDGTVIVMAGDTQRNWQHAVPKEVKIQAPRYNLTFRCFKSPPPAAP